MTPSQGYWNYSSNTLTTLFPTLGSLRCHQKTISQPQVLMWYDSKEHPSSPHPLGTQQRKKKKRLQHVSHPPSSVPNLCHPNQRPTRAWIPLNYVSNVKTKLKTKTLVRRLDRVPSFCLLPSMVTQWTKKWDQSVYTLKIKDKWIILWFSSKTDEQSSTSINSSVGPGMIA